MMKIAISSSGNRLDSALDPRFGRCACFLIVDPADMNYTVLDNSAAAQSRGAGIQAAQLLADQNVDVLITGHVGPNAVQTLAAAGIDLVAQQQGTVKEIIERYKGGGLKATNRPTVGSHFGMGGGRVSRFVRGMRQGAGGGRGMRQGQYGGSGRGMGRAGGRGMGPGGGVQRR
jgi:predicted Fe-Mo cluster-binding NifX family protein